jgi:hypothetical protein
MRFYEDEFKLFQKNHTPVDYGDEFVDGSCNRWSEVIYEIDGKFYSIQTLEGNPLKAYTDKGYVDYYDLQEVVRKEETRYYYVPVEDDEIPH